MLKKPFPGLYSTTEAENAVSRFLTFIGSSDKSHPWLYQSALRRKRGLRLATKSIAYSDRFCRHILVPGEGLNFSDLPTWLTAIENGGTSLCRAQAAEKLRFSTAC